MRVGSFLMALCFFVVILVGFQLVAIQVRANSITADVDVDPDTLNLKSNGKFVTAYIELPEGHNVSDIVLETVYLEGVPAITDPRYGFVTSADSYLMDHDGDGILERMVKFDRASLILMIEHMSPLVKEVLLRITGNLYDGNAFEGSDTIKVL